MTCPALQHKTAVRAAFTRFVLEVPEEAFRSAWLSRRLNKSKHTEGGGKIDTLTSVSV